jgi:hypothetical protein
MPISRREDFQEIDRLAKQSADKRGARPKTDAVHAALLTGIGVFFLLELFAVVVTPDPVRAFLPAAGLTILVAGGVYLTIRSQEKRWSKDYHDAIRELQREQDRSKQRGWSD